MLKRLHNLHRRYKTKREERKEIIAKIVFDKKNELEKYFDYKDIKKVLLLRYDDKIGDMVTMTMMIREMKKKLPDCQIDIVTRNKSIFIIDENPYINKIFFYNKNIFKDYQLSKELSKNSYDLVFSFAERMRGKELFFIRNIKSKAYIGVNKQNYKLFKFSVDNKVEHITERYKSMLNLIGIKDINTKYDLYLNEENKKKINKFFSKMKNEKTICINPYGASKYRQLRVEGLLVIVKKILNEIENIDITFIFPPDKREELQKLTNLINSDRVYLFGELKTIKDSISIINRSNLIISPDTSIVHIASALDKEQIAIYEQDYYQKE